MHQHWPVGSAGKRDRVEPQRFNPDCFRDDDNDDGVARTRDKQPPAA